MGSDLPVLKPKEVVKILNSLGFELVRQIHTNNFVIQMAELQQCPCINLETYRPYYLDKVELSIVYP